MILQNSRDQFDWRQAVADRLTQVLRDGRPKDGIDHAEALLPLNPAANMRAHLEYPDATTSLLMCLL
jgi:hypothetical protein